MLRLLDRWVVQGGLVRIFDVGIQWVEFTDDRGTDRALSVQMRWLAWCGPGSLGAHDLRIVVIACAVYTFDEGRVEGTLQLLCLPWVAL